MLKRVLKGIGRGLVRTGAWIIGNPDEILQLITVVKVIKDSRK